MLADIAWGITKSGNAKTGFLCTIIDAVAPRLAEATCQDIATLSTAFAEQTFEEAEVLLHGIFQQVKLRLSYTPSVASPAVATQPPGVNAPPPAAGGAPAADGSTSSSAEPAAEAAPASASEPPKQKLPAWQLVGNWRFSCAQIVEVVSAAAKNIRLYDEALFNMAAQQFLPRMMDFRPLHLHKLREAFEIMRHDLEGEFLTAVRAAQLLPKNRVAGLPASSLVRQPQNLLDNRPRGGPRPL